MSSITTETIGTWLVRLWNHEMSPMAPNYSLEIQRRTYNFQAYGVFNTMTVVMVMSVVLPILGASTASCVVLGSMAAFIRWQVDKTLVGYEDPKSILDRMWGVRQPSRGGNETILRHFGYQAAAHPNWQASQTWLLVEVRNPLPAPTANDAPNVIVPPLHMVGGRAALPAPAEAGEPGANNDSKRNG